MTLENSEFKIENHILELKCEVWKKKQTNKIGNWKPKLNKKFWEKLIYTKHSNPLLSKDYLTTWTWIVLELLKLWD